MKAQIAFCVFISISMACAMNDNQAPAVAASEFPEGTCKGAFIMFYQQGERGAPYAFFTDAAEENEDIVLRYDLFEDENEPIVVRFGLLKDLGTGILGRPLKYFCGKIISEKDLLVSEELHWFERGKKGVAFGGNNDMSLELLKRYREMLFSEDIHAFVQKYSLSDSAEVALERSKQLKILQELYFDGVQVSSEELDELCSLSCEYQYKETIRSASFYQECKDLLSRQFAILQECIDRFSIKSAAKR